VDAGSQTQTIQQRQLVGVKEALQQQDRPLPAALAQQHRLLQIQQGKTVRGTQRAPDAVDPMPVGVGFYHRPDPRPWRGAANHL